MAFVTVSDEDKYICIWGNPEHPDTNLNIEMITNYRNQGYAIVRLNNGTGHIKDCFRTIAKSISI